MGKRAFPLEKVFTVTNDNGGEFRFKEKEAYVVFWCEPHKPQKRGAVENMIEVLDYQTPLLKKQITDFFPSFLLSTRTQ